MWTDVQFWKDATWRAFRTFLQTISGLLVMTNISSAFNAPWKDLLGAALIAAFISIAQSIDRGRVATGPIEPLTPAATPEPPAEKTAAQPASFAAVSPVYGCGDSVP